MRFVQRRRSLLSRFLSLALLASTLAVLGVGPAQAAPSATIMEIQGAGHLSPYEGVEVTTTGVVTAVGFRHYYIQDPVGDGDPATADGMFVFDSGFSPTVGDYLQLTDTVTENVGGGCATGNLSTTQMSFPTTVSLGTMALPAPQVIGTSGRVPPNTSVVDMSQEPFNIQPSFCAGGGDEPTYDPVSFGIDFFESLEGMLVTVEDPVAVSGTRTFSPFSSEVFTLPNNGAHVAPTDARTARGGISLQPHPDNLGDANPERVQIQFDPTISGGATVPALAVGDQLDDVTGVVGYSFGNFEVNATHQVTFVPGGLTAETTSLVTPDERPGDASDRIVTVASYNVLNLDATSGDDAQRATLAAQIVDNLGTPDVLAIQEIQDNNGTTNDGTTDATQTMQMLVDAISAAGGPDYEFFDVAPADGASGGAPGSNIRNAFLYNPDRVKLLDFESLTPDVLAAVGADDPLAFTGTRDPLAATFRPARGGPKFTVVNNHLTSRFGSTPIYGGPQPFVQAGEAAREAQMMALNQYVDAIPGTPGRTHVMVVGDLNTFEFTNDLTEILPGTDTKPLLVNLIDSVTDDNVYTFNFEGNSQVLDHFLVSRSLADDAEFDIVHINVDFARVSSAVGSDHEAMVARLDLSG